MAKALVLAEHKDGKVKKSSLEVIHALSSQGCEVDVIAFGANLANQTADLAKDVGAQGAKKLIAVSDAQLNYYQSEVYASTLAENFKSGGYEILGGSASAIAK